MRHEQQVELRGGIVERTPTQTDDISEHEAMIAEEAHDVADFGPAFYGRDGAGLDDDCIDLGQSAGHAVEHHEFGTLHVDLAQRWTFDGTEEAVETTQRNAVDAPHADAPTLTIADVDQAFDVLAAASGPGSAATRSGALAGLAGRATAPEWELVCRVMLGELRTGALEGVLLDAVARAADQPAASVRRAAMLSGDLGETARLALTGADQLTVRATGKPIPDDEPVFVLRAQDVHAVNALLGYSVLLDNPEHRAAVEQRIKEFEAFRAAHPERMKFPDTAAA